MILKGSQRGGGQQLAAHLMNGFDNEVAELVEIRGTVAQDLSGAFAEISAIARAGTKLEREFYHLSVSPDPAQGRLTREQYLELLDRVERSHKLVGQPRAVVFHIKDGREHCHAVWSRVDAEKMKGINIHIDQLKLRDVTREFARDHGLELPEGIKENSKDKQDDRSKQENLSERQQKERTGLSKAQIMDQLSACWRQTDDGHAFVNAMARKGYFLARGDKRDYVVIDLHGEAYSLSRYLKGTAKAKEMRERLVNQPLAKLGSVEEVRAYAKTLRDKAAAQIEKPAEKTKAEKRADDLTAHQAARRAEIDKARVDTIARHLSERETLKAVHEAEATGIVTPRLAKQSKGLLAFIARVTGIKLLNEYRQRQQDDKQRNRQFHERQALLRRHDRELREVDRHYRAFDRLEARENRAAGFALMRENFRRLRAKILGIPERTVPDREIKPEFDSAANPELQRTGTGDWAEIFKRAVDNTVPQQDKEQPEVKPDFDKAAKPPIDLLAAFNRTVDERLAREDRAREHDGPGRDFDPER